MNWKQSAERVRWNVQPFIDGKYRASTSSDVLANINPATETELCEFAIGNAADVNAAVDVASRRFEDGCWSAMPPARRGEVLFKLADLIAKHKSEIALLDTLEMGKPIQAALADAEGLAPHYFRLCAGFADKLMGATAPSTRSTIELNTYEPRGVVAAISPWNFPSANAAIKCAPALAAGNSVVLKPSEVASSSALKIAELALEAGVPEGVLNVVPGDGRTTGSALASHPDVDLISFTGSTATGRTIMELAGRSNLTPVLLECGGKSPQIIFDDVLDLDFVAAATVQSAFRNQGQVCSAHTRVVVHEKIRDALVQRIFAIASRYVPRDPLDETTSFGPLASAAQRARVKAFVEQGCKAGAEVVLKGAIQESGGCYVGPTIFDRVQPTMSIAREEIFGPVLCVLSFKSEEEAISLANSTPYGLAATLWTRDMGRAKRLARAVKVGHITIRTSGEEGPLSGCRLSREPQKASGFGSELGIRGLESYSTLKCVNFTGA